MEEKMEDRWNNKLLKKEVKAKEDRWNKKIHGREKEKLRKKEIRSYERKIKS